MISTRIFRSITPSGAPRSTVVAFDDDLGSTASASAYVEVVAKAGHATIEPIGAFGREPSRVTGMPTSISGPAEMLVASAVLRELASESKALQDELDSASSKHTPFVDGTWLSTHPPAPDRVIPFRRELGLKNMSDDSLDTLWPETRVVDLIRGYLWNDWATAFRTQDTFDLKALARAALKIDRSDKNDDLSAWREFTAIGIKMAAGWLARTMLDDFIVANRVRR
jgi:hypothetical protein